MDKKFAKKGRLPFRGQSLFYLLKKVPNHGVGRLIIRGSVRQDKMKPTYMRILDVDIKPIDGLKKRKKKYQHIPVINVMVEKTIAGLTVPKPRNLRNISHLADFLLIPEEEESKYVNNSVVIPEQKGHYLLSKSLRNSINQLVEEGMPLVDARKIVIEREKTRLAEEGGSQGDIAALDGYEYDEELEEDDDDHDEDAFLRQHAVKVRENNSNGNIKTEERTPQQNRSRHVERNGRSEQNVEISLEEDEIGDFTEAELRRINKMISNGVHYDTARQLEWERKMARMRDKPITYWTSASSIRYSGNVAKRAKHE